MLKAAIKLKWLKAAMLTVVHLSQGLKVRSNLMWLAVVMLCTSPSVYNCSVISKTDEIFETLQSCKNETNKVVDYLKAKGAYAIPYCIKVGNNV
jgi:hypothetical protein